MLFTPVTTGRGITDVVPAALRTLAHHVCECWPISIGRHDAPKPPALLDVLTDELLMVANDAVTAVAAELVPKASGNAQWRILAWTVAAARGATTNLDAALALTVGKRLDRQAQKVHADLAAARTAAEVERCSARAAAATDATLAGMLTATLVAIDVRERKALTAPATEEYIGFHELNGLLPEPPPPPAPLPASQAPSLPESYNCVRYPWLVESTHEQASYSAGTASVETTFPPIPPDLAAVLGRDATQALWDDTMQGAVLGRTPYQYTDHWWCYGLPYAYKTLLAKHAILVEQLGKSETQVEELIDSCAARLSSLHEQLARDVDDLTEENERLSREATKARAREEALQDVIARMAGSQAR